MPTRKLLHEGSAVSHRKKPSSRQKREKTLSTSKIKRKRFLIASVPLRSEANLTQRATTCKSCHDEIIRPDRAIIILWYHDDCNMDDPKERSGKHVTYRGGKETYIKHQITNIDLHMNY